MLNLTEYDALLKVAVKELAADFPTLNPVELAHAMARANIEIRSGYELLAICDVNRIEYNREVTTLARQDLEYITGRRRPIMAAVFHPSKGLCQSDIDLVQ
jgi:hypothetical protein